MSEDDSQPAGHLADAAAELAEARSSVANLIEAVIAEQADLASWGFHGIARNLQRVVDALTTIQATVGTAAGTARTLATNASGISAEPVPHEVLRALEPLSAGIDSLVDAGNAFDGTLADAQRLIAEVLEGGSPEVWIRRVGTFRGMARIAAASLAQARDAASRMVEEARQAGTVTPVGASGPARSPESVSNAKATVAARGRNIPPGVRRLPSGRLPANYAYAGRMYDGPGWTPTLAAKYPDGVRFTDDGYPDFAPYALHTVTIEPTFVGDRTTDFTRANRQAGLSATPDGYIWHHHQDTRTMHLVPEDLHEAVRHAGGVAIMKGRKDGRV